MYDYNKTVVHFSKTLRKKIIEKIVSLQATLSNKNLIISSI